MRPMLTERPDRGYRRSLATHPAFPPVLQSPSASAAHSGASVLAWPLIRPLADGGC